MDVRSPGCVLSLTCSPWFGTSGGLWGWPRPKGRKSQYLKQESNWAHLANNTMLWHPQRYVVIYLVTVLQQHPSSSQLVDSVQVEGTGGGMVRGLGEFLESKIIHCLSKVWGSPRQFHVFHEISYLYSTVFSCANIIAQGFSIHQIAF